LFYVFTGILAYLAVLASSKGSGFELVPSKAAKLLEEIRDRYAKGEANLRPDYITYTNVIRCCAENGNDKRSLEVLLLMIDDYNGGNASAKPDIFCFNSVLVSFQGSTRIDAPERSITFFEYMQSRIEPDTFSYNARK
jgi:pentatricopeptide repeat protein